MNGPREREWVNCFNSRLNDPRDGELPLAFLFTSWKVVFPTFYIINKLGFLVSSLSSREIKPLNCLELFRFDLVIWTAQRLSQPRTSRTNGWTGEPIDFPWIEQFIIFIFSFFHQNNIILMNPTSKWCCFDLYINSFLTIPPSPNNPSLAQHTMSELLPLPELPSDPLPLTLTRTHYIPNLKPPTLESCKFF